MHVIPPSLKEFIVSGDVEEMKSHVVQSDRHWLTTEVLPEHMRSVRDEVKNRMEQEADARMVDYVSKLSLRWSEAVIVPRVDVACADWKPSPKQCHDNVTKWVELNPKHRAVRGWLILDLRTAILLGQLPRVELLAHAIVEDEDKKLLDITPVQAPYGTPNTYPFLFHAGNQDDFVALIAEHRLSRIRIYGLTPERITYLPL
jgi:hypothetical protein